MDILQVGELHKTVIVMFGTPEVWISNWFTFC